MVNVTVTSRTHTYRKTTGYVAFVTTSDAVVVGDAEGRPIDRILDAVTLYGGVESAG